MADGIESLQPELAALYRDADVLLAAAACDDAGDATAQQFVACRVDEPGVLILAPFAAGAATLPQALLANPHDCDAAAETLRRALEMVSILLSFLFNHFFRKLL